MVRKSDVDEYRGQRKGGGTRIILVQSTQTYKQIAEKAIDAFFPGRKNKGVVLKSHRWDGLGTYQGIIPEEGFDLQLLVEANGGPSKTKIYLYLTAKKVNTKSEYKKSEWN